MSLLSSFKKNKASQIERRLEQRHPSHFSATLSQPQEEDKEVEKLIVTILNFSKSGLAVLAHKAVLPNRILDIQLSFNSERTVNTAFKVIQCQEVKSGYLIRCKIAEPCSQYDALYTKITQPRHSVVSECW